jgi:hypothetical protein
MWLKTVLRIRIEYARGLYKMKARKFCLYRINPNFDHLWRVEQGFWRGKQVFTPLSSAKNLNLSGIQF